MKIDNRIFEWANLDSKEHPELNRIMKKYFTIREDNYPDALDFFSDQVINHFLIRSSQDIILFLMGKTPVEKLIENYNKINKSLPVHLALEKSFDVVKYESFKVISKSEENVAKLFILLTPKPEEPKPEYIVLGR